MCKDEHILLKTMACEDKAFPAGASALQNMRFRLFCDRSVTECCAIPTASQPSLHSIGHWFSVCQKNTKASLLKNTVTCSKSVRSYCQLGWKNTLGEDCSWRALYFSWIIKKSWLLIFACLRQSQAEALFDVLFLSFLASYIKEGHFH